MKRDEAFTRLPLPDLIYQRDKVLELANDSGYTTRTRSLAYEVAEQMTNCIYFMLQTSSRRRQLRDEGISPLRGNFSWREEEAKHRGNETWTGE